MVESSFLSDSGVDVFEDLFADSSDFAFSWINESACGLVLEVVFMVFKRYECLPLCHTFCTVVDVEVSTMFLASLLMLMIVLSFAFL